MAQFVAIASAVMSVVSKFKEGRQARADGEFMNAQAQQNAGQELAAGQRRAAEARRQARLANSRLQALAQGGGSDPTVVNLSADLAGEGELRALSSLYESSERARGLELQGESARLSGRNRQDAAQISAVGSALRSGSSMYNSFGNGGPSYAGGN